MGIYDTLIDYNDLDIGSVQSQFPILNEEVIFHATRLNTSSPIAPNKARVDTVLYNKYKENDLRRKLFYRKNIDGVHSFYADYGGSINSSTFSGFATDELI